MGLCVSPPNRTHPPERRFAEHTYLVPVGISYRYPGSTNTSAGQIRTDTSVGEEVQILGVGQTTVFSYVLLL